MKKIFISIIMIIMIVIIGIGLYNDNKKIYYEPEYNAELITRINDISIINNTVKNKYQFVFVTDLHASVIDDNEKDEKIKQALVERNGEFSKQNSKGIQSDKIFPEIINYTNNRNVDGLLLGGDIIDSPSDSNFNFLRNNLKNLKLPYLYTFGNHDWTFAWDYQTKETEEKFCPKFLEFMDDTEVSYLEYKDLIVLAINNSKSKINDSALEKIEQVLAKGKPTLVMLHVPLATKYISEEAIQKRNRVSAIGEYGIKPDEPTQKVIDMILSKDNNVFYVIAGHVHFEVKDDLNESVFEYVSSPAYAGEINVIKINN